MLGDPSNQPAIEKFSFIDLNLPEKSNRQETVTPSQNKSAQKSVRASALAVASNTASSIDTSWYNLDTAAYNLDIAEIISHSNVNNSRQVPAPRYYLGKILFALACSYCLFVLWWLFGHQGSRIVTILTGGKQIILPRSELEFIDYMERSLDNIDRQLEADKSDFQDDVVYVPVQTPISAAPYSTSTNILPALPSLPNSTSTHAETKAVKSEPTSSQVRKIPAPPPLPVPNPLVDTASSPETQAALSNIKPVHTLTGILELGENRSAVLVKVKGKTRRVWLGEEINNSGWILDSIGNQNATISNEGEVRSITIGETF